MINSSLSCLLLVDDNPRTRKALAGLFRDRGYIVEEAGSTTEALGWLQDRKSELSFVLLDQVIDGNPEGGTQIVKEIRQIRPDLFIVMYTADPDIEDPQRWRAMNAGAHRYIKKASAQDLLNDVDDFIQDMTELQELTRQFEKIGADRLEIASALVGLDIGVTLIDREYRVWFANKAQSDLIGQASLVGAPCWVYSHGHQVEQGPCFGCTANAAFVTGTPQTRTYLSRFPSGKVGWLQAQTTPVFTESPGKARRVIAVRMVTQKLSDTVQQMELKERLRGVAQGVVLAGFGRARIYQMSADGSLKCLTAASGPNSSNDQAYREKVSGFETFPDRNGYLKKAVAERRGTLHTQWDLSLGIDTDFRLQIDLRPPWIDLPIWHDSGLIGWLGVDIVDGKRSKLSLGRLNWL